MIEFIEKGAPRDKAKNALVLLHGRGAPAEDIMSLADLFADETYYVVAPRAPNRSWYPQSFMADISANEPWLSHSIEALQLLLDDISQTIPYENMVLMGFSQGACLSLEIPARHAVSYKGIVSFTGGLIGKELEISRYTGDFKGTKVFIGNSDKDPHVPHERSQKSADLLKKLGADVQFKTYPGMNHTINEDEIKTVQQWIFKK